MGFPSVLTMAQQWVAERVQPGGTVLDATAGGGVDTLFLARIAGPRGKVYAFDVQEEALARTSVRLENARRTEALAEVELLHTGHERMAETVPAALHGKIQAVMFNLGYLPGGSDLGVITRPDTTLAALEQALALLAPGGALTAVLYPGHPGGETEALAVEAWAAGLPADRAQAVLYRFPQRPHAPYLIALEKRQEDG